MLITATGMLVNPFGWILLCTATAPLLGGAIVLVGFVTWPGLEVATMNYMFDLAGSRDETGSGTAMVAINNIVSLAVVPCPASSVVCLPIRYPTCIGWCAVSIFH